MSTNHTTEHSRTSYLVAVTGSRRGAIAQCYARSPKEAERAVQALVQDCYGEESTAICIDTGAAAGIWIEGDAEYIRAAIAAATGEQT